MSMIIGTWKNPMTFEEYMLSEAVEPTETPYGSNPPLFDDKKISYMGESIKGSIFNYGEHSYFVQSNFLTGEIGFAKSPLIRSKEELEEVVFDVKPVGNSDGLGVFNRAFYVLVEMLKENPHDFYFTSANSDLKHFYDVLVRSKFFNRKLHELGYTSLYYEDGRYLAKLV